MKSRIAIFEGYTSPFGRPAPSSLGRRTFGGRLGRSSLGRPLGGSLGRRAYYVPPARYVSSDDRGGYGPARKPRKGYRVKRMKDTPAMKRAQARFKRAAKKCAKRRNARSTFVVCMRRELKKKR